MTGPPDVLRDLAAEDGERRKQARLLRRARKRHLSLKKRRNRSNLGARRTP